MEHVTAGGRHLLAKILRRCSRRIPSVSFEPPRRATLRKWSPVVGMPQNVCMGISLYI